MSLLCPPCELQPIIPIRQLALIGMLVVLSGCGFGHDERVTGDYRLIADDVPDQMSLSRRLPDGNAIGRINETVFVVGWNHRYIVSKRHPAKNRKVTHYYYLDMSRDSIYADPSQSVAGPLSLRRIIGRPTMPPIVLEDHLG
jgi:hypothetical protein